ncbi:MAG: C4-dicarboxylate transporter substrate-binding protein [Arthrobacter sp.]|nr:C4-dicarboxylate transporter substrate-binding protein [Arthrobacter sp.]
MTFQFNFTRRAALAAGAAGVVLAMSACAGGGTGTGAGQSAGAEPIKKLSIIVPANPGGGWDQTGRAMQQDLQSNKIVSSAQVTNVGGGGGTNGLAQLATEKDVNTLMVMGYVMVGAVETNAAQTRLEDTTPIARLTEEPLVLVVPASSKYQSVADLVEDIKATGKGVAITGGSAGGADHILAGQILKSQGVAADKLNYIGYSGAANPSRRCWATRSRPASRASANTPSRSRRARSARWPCPARPRLPRCPGSSRSRTRASTSC